MGSQHVSIDDRSRLASSSARSVALDCLVAGVDAAQLDRIVADALTFEDGQLTVAPVGGPQRTYDFETYDNVVVLGGGNAAGHFAAALESLLGDAVDGGAVVTDDPVETEHVEVLRGDHPTPSRRGVGNTHRVAEVARRAGPNDLVLGCLTGGGSALLAAPAGDISLDDLQTTTAALLASGATIGEINAVRKHLSEIKGGRLARAVAPATVVGLAVSDVTDDDPAVIASGPLAPDSTTYADALDVLDRYDTTVPSVVRAHLRAGATGDIVETPTATASVFNRVDFHVVASAATALDAASEVALDNGYTPLVLSSRIRGEAQAAAKTQAAIAEEIRTTGTPVESPAVVLSGGETTVTLAEDHGSGGPNQEFVLTSALELQCDDVVVAAVDTDGIDGATDAAGAIVDDETVGADGPVASSVALDALDRNDAYPVLDDADSLVRTGPTGTNVNDLRILVVD